jgi:hypothetical protein
MGALWRSKTRVRASRGPRFGGGSGATIFIRISMPPALPPRAKPGPGAYARAIAGADLAVATAFAQGERAPWPKNPTLDTRRVTPARSPHPSPHRSVHKGRGKREGVEQGVENGRARCQARRRGGPPRGEEGQGGRQEEAGGGCARGSGGGGGGGVEAVRRHAQGAARHCREKAAARLGCEQGVGCSRRRAHDDDGGVARQDVHVLGRRLLHQVLRARQQGRADWQRRRAPHSARQED